MIKSVASQRGATLIELMISLVIGLAIVAGLGQIFMSGRSSSSLQERLGALQENGRYALYFLQRDIRNAGLPYMDGTFSAFVPPTGAAPNNSVDGGGNAPDRIAITYRARAAVAGGDCLGNNVALNALVTTTYSIDVDAATGVSRLMCSAQGVAAQPLVDGIENLQVLYGVDLDTDVLAAGYGYADMYVPAGAVTATQWQRQIVSVRVSVLASTITPVAGDKAGDNTATYVLLDAPAFGPIQKNFPAPGGPLTNLRGRVFTTTIEVRNRTQ